MARTAPSGPGKFDYSGLLKKARENLPAELASDVRWKLPEADVQIEGRTTILRNFDAMTDATRRESSHLMQFILRELGTAGDVDGTRLVVQGKVPPKKMVDILNDYVETYVMCSECHRPDTKLEKQDRTTLLRCEACGAFKPVKARKAKPQAPPEPAVKEGKVVEVNIVDTGQRGDGVARLENYVIYVQGAMRGQRVKALIERVSGNIAFAKAVPG